MAKEYLIQGDTLTNIADKIRVLSGTEGALKLDDMAVTLETSNTNLDNELNTQSGLIDQIQSVVNELPEVSDLEPVLQEKTVTPTTSPQNVVADSGFDGLSRVTVNGDANLKAENIAEGISIFGITGTHSGGGSGGGSVETCTITIVPDAMLAPSSPTYYYTDAATMTVKSLSTQNAQITVLKNSIVVIVDWSSYSTASGSCSQIFYKTFHAAYQVTGDCTFKYSM